MKKAVAEFNAQPAFTHHKAMEFAQALDEARASHSKIHLLLGNGFSRAFRDNIFAYGGLFERADFAALSPAARAAFDALGTRDFEVVIRAMRQAATLSSAYSLPVETGNQMRRDADGLREVLVAAIANSHPEHPIEITNDQYAACRAFLAPFDRTYSLNYDLLLYWVLMHTDAQPEVAFDDGFRNSEEDGADYVVWDPAASSRAQNIFYVHGGLHLFDAGAQLVKYTWSRTQIRLIQQVRSALAHEKYPLFVAEGSSEDKLVRIRHHAYLGRIERSFLEITGALFLYGVSCGDSDQHILDWIAKGKLTQLYVGLYGDENSGSNQTLKRRVDATAGRRPLRKPLRVSYFDAASARVWG